MEERLYKSKGWSFLVVNLTGTLHISQTALPLLPLSKASDVTAQFSQRAQMDGGRVSEKRHLARLTLNKQRLVNLSKTAFGEP